MAFVVAREAQNQVAGARLSITVEPRRKTSRRAGITGLATTHNGCRLAVVTLEEPVQPVVGARVVVVERYCQIHRPAEVGRVAAGIPGDGSDMRQTGGKLRSAGGDREPAVEILAGAV